MPGYFHRAWTDTRALLIDGTMDAVITHNPQVAMVGCLAIFANLRAGRDAMHGFTHQSVR
jgi:LacI family transcriptional regulator